MNTKKVDVIMSFYKMIVFLSELRSPVGRILMVTMNGVVQKPKGRE